MNHLRHRTRGTNILGSLPGFIAVCALLLMATAPRTQAAWSNGNWTEVFTSNEEIDHLSVASDGAGGTLAIILNAQTYPKRGMISRLNHTGSKLWGNDGTLIPFNIFSSDQLQPVDIAPDGSGGAYCVWQEWYTVDGVFRLGRFDASGSMMWAVDVATAGSDAGSAGAQLVLEPGIGITLGYAEAANQRIYATRYDPNGNFIWSADANTFYEHNVLTLGGVTEFDMQPDGQGGVLFAWYRYDLAEYLNSGIRFEQIGANRIDSNGNQLWGADGHMVWQQPGFWHVSAYHAKILNDGAGGAYVVTSGGSRAYGQHINAAGSETWAANGIELQQVGTADLDTDPQICTDGAGGMILAQYNGNILATRIDVTGAQLWGTAGVTVASVSSGTEFFDDPCLDADGFGGAVVGYHRWDNGAESLGGARLDGFGLVVWNNENLFSAVSNDEIRDVHVVADGLGGAQYVWKRHVPDVPRKDDVYALGVDSQGQPPNPALYGLYADAGEPGEILPILIFGDYIDANYDYDLRHGYASIPFTGLSEISNQLVGGWLDLTGAAIGPWDLYAGDGGGDRANLENAFGVGLRPPCTTDINLGNGQMEPFGTRRKMKYDANGDCRFSWLYYNQPTNQQFIYGGHYQGGGWGYGPVEVSTGAGRIKDLAFTIDEAGRHVYVYVRDGTWIVSHTYENELDLVPDLTIDQTLGYPLSNPVVGQLPDGTTHVIVEMESMGAKNLQEVWRDGPSIWSVGIPNLGTNAHSPDIAETGDGLTLVYVRDSWLPGVSEVCLAHQRNGTWEAPIVLTFGLSITSPSVAWDGGDEILVAWVLDNSGNGSGPALQTTLVEKDVPGPVRTRATDGLIYRVQVDAQGLGRFYMVTQETGQPMQFFIRGGNGNVFYPKLRLNSFDDSDWPMFASEHGGTGVMAIWQSYNTPSWGDAIMSWQCDAGVSTAVRDETPETQDLSATAYPNPFNPSTTIAFDLQSAEWVRVQIYDVQGRLVRTLQDGEMAAGHRALRFDGRNDSGAPLASGVYFAQVRRSVGAPSVVKLTLLK